MCCVTKEWFTLYCWVNLGFQMFPLRCERTKDETLSLWILHSIQLRVALSLRSNFLYRQISSLTARLICHLSALPCSSNYPWFKLQKSPAVRNPAHSSNSVFMVCCKFSLIFQSFSVAVEVGQWRLNNTRAPPWALLIFWSPPSWPGAPLHLVRPLRVTCWGLLREELICVDYYNNIQSFHPSS